MNSLYTAIFITVVAVLAVAWAAWPRGRTWVRAASSSEGADDPRLLVEENENRRLRNELSKLEDAKKFMDEWPAVQAEIARQNGAGVNQGESLQYVQRIESLQRVLDRMRVRKENAYAERNKVVAALASCYKSGRRKTEIDGWDSEWHNCVYIDLPTGQVSWHYHDSHAHLFAHLPRYRRKWDGHTTEVKYERLAEFARDYAPVQEKTK